MIGYFDDLKDFEKEAVLQLLENQIWRRIEVLDHWMDDSMYMLLIKASTWPLGVVRFVVGHITMEQVAAFHHCESPYARKIVRDYLRSRP